MKKSLFAGVLLITTLLSPAFASAQVVGDVNPDGATSACIDLQYNLKYRSTDAKTNGEVSLLQDFLQTQGYLNSEPTGYFGRLTEGAVKSFQAANGILDSGYVGPITRAKIKEISCGDATLSSSTSSVTKPKSATVQFINAPTLGVVYDVNNKETTLSGRSTSVKITAGTSPISFYLTNGVPYVLRLAEATGKNTGVFSFRMENTDANSRYSGLTTIQAGKSATYSISVSASTKELFAGTYSLVATDLQTGQDGAMSSVIPASSYKGTTVSNAVTIIGEVSPYINSIVPAYPTVIMSGESMTITGVRFDPLVNYIVIDGVKENKASSSDNGTTITFTPSNDSGITAGIHTLQIETTNGASNKVTVNIGQTDTAIVDSKNLQIVYDKDNKEAELRANFIVNVFAGSADMKLHKDCSAAPCFAISLSDSLGTDSNVSGSGITVNSVTNATDDGTYWTIRAGQKASFGFLKSWNTKSLFAGTYYGKLWWVGPPSYSSENISNTDTATIIGEVSPYISTITPSDPTTNQTITITGVRFDPTINTVSVGDGVFVAPAASNGTTISFIPSVAGITEGSYPVQVTRLITGASNKVYVNIVATATTTPTCKVIDIYATQVPGYVYYELFMKTQGLGQVADFSLNSGSPQFGVTGADSWNNLLFTNGSGGLSWDPLKATQTINSTGISYILARENNIALTQNGKVICSSISGQTAQRSQLQNLASVLVALQAILKGL